MTFKGRHTLITDKNSSQKSQKIRSGGTNKFISVQIQKQAWLEIVNIVNLAIEEIQQKGQDPIETLENFRDFFQEHLKKISKLKEY